MDRNDAEEFTQSLGQIVGGSWRQIVLAKRLGVPKALGLTVEDWVNGRLGGYIRMNVEDRRKAASELSAEGASTREIAEVLGVAKDTVRRDLTGANAPEDTAETTEIGANAPPAPIDAVAALAVTNVDAADEREILEAAKEIRERKAAANQAERESARREALSIDPPRGKYRVIVIDPPWQMEKIERDVAPDQVGFDYPTMDERELALFNVGEFADENCHLFCWTTHKHLPSALRLLDAWGFRYVLTMVWHKPGGFQPFGLPQYNCEFALYARRGNPEFLDTKAFPVCFEAPRREHSRKPDEFYDLINRVTSGPRIDVFSREDRAGFSHWGNEVGKFAA